MKAKNLNASSVKTRNLIRDTFAELLYEKKNINKITVTELVQRADINRSTFYSHYDDVRHVAEDIKAETLKAFFENKTISNVHDIEPFFDDIIPRAASTTIFTAWLSVCFIVSAFGISCWVRLTITPATIPARRP